MIPSPAWTMLFWGKLVLHAKINLVMGGGGIFQKFLLTVKKM